MTIYYGSRIENSLKIGCSGYVKSSFCRNIFCYIKFLHLWEVHNLFNRKFLASFFLSVLLAFSFEMVASYASDTTQDNSIKVLLDGKYLQFNEPPVEMNGSTLVPMRDIFEALGATLSWDDSTSTATGAKGTTKVILQLDNPTAYINDEPITLSVPGTLVNNKTMVPTRFIAESMNCVVSWDEGTKTVIIVPDKIIEFDDENLEKAIKIAINSNKYKLNVSDVASLQSLIANDSKISNLNGLQYLIGLNTLSLNKNEIK